MNPRTFTFEMLSLLVATAAAACGGKAIDDAASSGASSSSGTGTGSSSGSSASRGGETNSGDPGSSSSGTGTSVYSDCGPITTKVQELDANLCEPQLVSQMSYSPASKCGDVVCHWSVTIPCDGDNDGGGGDGGGGGGGVVLDGGADGGSEGTCLEICEKTMPKNAASGSHFCSSRNDGKMTYVSCGGCGVGRPPSGFVAKDVDAPTEEGAWLARMAQLEAASVEAFDALHDDLAMHGAPDSLLRHVRIAADDETRHARLAREQAERRGAIVPDVDVHVVRGRSLEELAIENAREGCVEETFGAVVARMQAERATDPELRTMLEAIARDELGHAFLSWRVADWLHARIADDARDRVRHARAEKLAALRRTLPRDTQAALETLAPAIA
jgi:hypothetical protein